MFVAESASGTLARPEVSDMTAMPRHKMTVDEYLAWAEDRPGRYELYAGTVYAMAPERARHAEVKFAAQTALVAAIGRAGLPCHMLPDGMTVRVDRDTAHEPDALVYCGEKLPDSAIEVPNPMIVVEVLSPSTRSIDATAKLSGYFQIESIQHYLILNTDKRLVVHHARSGEDAIATRILNEGVLRLHPPGISLAVEDLFRTV
jgi:Uma2 family endonuclease